MIDKKRNKKKYNIAFIVSFIINLLLVICLIVSILFRNTTIVFNSDKSVFDEAYEILNTYWFNSTDETVDIEYSALGGMVSSLGDIHTDYYTIEEASEFNDSVSGTYVGIGVGFTMLDSGAIVTLVYDNTPSSKAGITEGDILLECDGVSFAGLTSDEVKEIVRGEEGTSVVLKIQRGTEIIEIEVAREDVDISASYYMSTENGVLYGHLGLTTFGTNTASEVEEALQIFEDAGVETLIIDLRDNGGGYLTAASAILNLFIEAGEPIYQMQSNSGPAEITYATAGTKYHFDTGYILINSGTASASELLTTSLQDMLGYKTVGTTSYGKGTAQTQYQLSDGSTLKYTYAKWMSAKGQYIHSVGIIPDIEVENLDLTDITTASLTEDLEVDAVDSRVQAMQKMLEILGYEIDRTDGYFSTETKAVLEQFELDNGLEQDGIYSDTDRQYLIAMTMIFINDDVNDIQYNTVISLLQ